MALQVLFVTFTQLSNCKGVWDIVALCNKFVIQLLCYNGLYRMRIAISAVALRNCNAKSKSWEGVKWLFEFQVAKEILSIL